jgi:hypothetical protein
MIGRPKARIGAKTATNVAPFEEPSIESIARRNPKKRLPESPRKILAG